MFRLPLAVTLSTVIAASSLTAGLHACGSYGDFREFAEPAEEGVEDQPVIQLAILLDDSGSMSGLIDQARAHIWDVVHQLGETTRDGKAPILEVAIFHYGDVSALHKPLLHFTNDLDLVSKTLFSINGGGGDEHCGEVIRNAAQQLKWSSNPRNLRMIVIAGNEPFNQGSVADKEAISAAKSKDIVVSTIHCGEEAQGVAGFWADGATYGGGSFYNIDHNQRSYDIEAPQDGSIRDLNLKLNQTYLYYGQRGRARQAEQVAQDGNADGLGSSAFAKRAQVKSRGNYVNAQWDLVDAVKADKDALKKVDKSSLPKELKALDEAELAAKVSELREQRDRIAKQLDALVKERDTYVRTERARLVKEGAAPNLGEALNLSFQQLAESKGYEVVDEAANEAPSDASSKSPTDKEN